MNNITDSKRSEQKEDHSESKTKSCPLKRKKTNVERTFRKSAGKLLQKSLVNLP